MDLTREQNYSNSEHIDSRHSLQGRNPPAWARNAFLKSFAYAFEGIAHVIRTQRNFRLQLSLAAAVVVAGLALGLNGLELAIVGLTIAFVTVAEMLNTVVESVVNLVTSSYDPRAKIAKDVSAGAVLLAVVWSLFVAVLVFGPHVLKLAGLPSDYGGL